MATVKLENVKKIYAGNVVAVHDFNLDIKDKEFIVFVGPSGCGKSTTLRMVAGLEEISEGTVSIDGNIVNDLQPKDREIAMVFQNYALYPHLSVYENMAFPLRISKIPTIVPLTPKDEEEVNKQIDELTAEKDKLVEEAKNPSNCEIKENECKNRNDAIDAKIAKIQANIDKANKKKTAILAVYDQKIAEANALVDETLATKEGKSTEECLEIDKVAKKLQDKADKALDAKKKVESSQKIQGINDAIQAYSFRIETFKHIQEDNRKELIYELAIKELEKQIAKLEEEKRVGKTVYTKMSNDEIYERVTNAANILGITPFLTRKPRALSGGQRQRVAIGRAMVKDSKVFLMDEPLSNLDAKLRNQMRAEIVLLRKKINTTFIYVTHDQTEAMTLGDRIVVMKDGFIMQVGTPHEVFDSPANLFVAEFIGAPKMNTFKTQLLVEDGKYYVTPFGAKIEVTGEKGEKLAAKKTKAGDIVLGVRPEHITLAKKAGPNTIPVTIQVNEMMGSELHLHVLTEDGASLIVRIPTIDLTEEERANMVFGAKLNITFEGKVMHFFDPETEKSLLL